MEERNSILIIDDDPRNIFALRAVLKAKAYPVLTASSAHEGLELLESDNSIRVVLLDIMMPDMDGYEALARIRANPDLKQVPVIAVTAQAMKGDREKCLEAGADGYISKPIDVDQLLSLLNELNGGGR